MKSGIELIEDERREQIEKHKFSLEDDTYYTNKQLLRAAQYVLMLAEFGRYKGMNISWPIGWDWYYHNKILNKTRQGKLIVAGALLIAENDRRGGDYHTPLITEIADELDRFNGLTGSKGGISDIHRRRARCPACSAYARGVKSRIAFTHTCGL